MNALQKVLANTHLLVTGVIALAALYFVVPGARTLVDDAMPQPALTAITLDAKRTAFLVFEFNAGDCGSEVRALCVAGLDKLHQLVGDAEGKGIRIVHFVGDSTEDELPDLRGEGIDTVMIAGSPPNASAAKHALIAVERGYRVALATDTMPLMRSNKEASAAFLLGMTLGLGKSATFTRTDMISF